MGNGMPHESWINKARARDERNQQVIAQLRASAGADAPIDLEKKIKRQAAELAILMALAHGGDWQVQLDLPAGLILVARRSSGRSVFSRGEGPS